MGAAIYEQAKTNPEALKNILNSKAANVVVPRGNEGMY